MQKVVAGANAITDFPYVFGGGHASFVDNAYDCSGSVSYALAAGGLLGAPETSGTLESWGVPGPGGTSRSMQTPVTPTCMSTACSTTPPGAAASTPHAGRWGQWTTQALSRATGPGCREAALGIVTLATLLLSLPVALDGESAERLELGHRGDLGGVDRLRLPAARGAVVLRVSPEGAREAQEALLGLIPCGAISG